MVAQLTKASIIGRGELERLVDVRLAEADVLREAGHDVGAIYLAGYAVECLLKVAICRTLGWEELRGTFKTHDLELLMLHSGFDGALRRDVAVVESFAKIRTLWNIDHADADGCFLRYRPPSASDRENADTFFQCVMDPQRGFVPWLRRMIS